MSIYAPVLPVEHFIQSNIQDLVVVSTYHHSRNLDISRPTEPPHLPEDPSFPTMSGYGVRAPSVPGRKDQPDHLTVSRILSRAERLLCGIVRNRVPCCPTIHTVTNHPVLCAVPMLPTATVPNHPGLLHTTSRTA